MAHFAYRAIAPDGRSSIGEIDAPTEHDAVMQIRRLGIAPISVRAVPAADLRRKKIRVDGKARKALTKAISEIAVLLNADLQLDRALALAIENVDHAGVGAALIDLLAAVRQGRPLSQAMTDQPGLFPPMACAMAEAGEANGKLGHALDRLATAMRQADDLRAIVTTALIYPVILLTIAVAVILMMLLFVVPQFEALFASNAATLPAESRFVLELSRFVRQFGLPMLLASLAAVAILRLVFRQPAVRAWFDASILKSWQVGTLVQSIETARFSRTLGALIDGGVPVPVALAVARRTIGNNAMNTAVGEAARKVKEGDSLTATLASAAVFPRMAIGFLRTGEEISQLAMMASRLADVLDADVKIRLQRLIGLLTPAITVILGLTVAAIIAAIMTAILGFNDVAAV